MSYIDVTPSEDIDAAAWIGPRLRPFNAYCAGSVVPEGYASYVRLDHERTGVLPQNMATSLIGVFGQLTPPLAQCWLAMWEGYGYLDLDSRGRSWRALAATAPESEPLAEPSEIPWPMPPQRSRSALRLELPHRRYLLYTGTLDRVPGWQDGPNLWWPDDRSWCVASEIDLPWTYVGGSDSTVAELIQDPALRATRITLDETWPSGGRPG